MGDELLPAGEYKCVRGLSFKLEIAFEVVFHFLVIRLIGTNIYDDDSNEKNCSQ